MLTPCARGFTQCSPFVVASVPTADTPAPAPESTPAPVPEAPITEASDVAEAPAPALDAAPVLEFATATFVAAAMLVL